MQEDPIVIVGAARTPMGGFQGSLTPLSAPELGGCAIQGAVERAGVPPEDIQDLIMGNVINSLIAIQKQDLIASLTLIQRMYLNLI